MTNKWQRKEERQGDHPGQMELDFPTPPQPAMPGKSETVSPEVEPEFKKEPT